LKVRVSRAARRDRRKATAWYREQSPAAARHFQERLAEALKFIAQYPEGAPVMSPGRRAKSLPIFPFSVAYEIRNGEIRVLAVIDERQNPDTKQ
jgi:plasmid stabilization system protein ParE